MSTFDFRSDDAGKDILAALLNAADRGVKVEIFADGFNSIIQMENNDYFYALSSNKNIKIIIIKILKLKLLIVFVNLLKIFKINFISIEMMKNS